MRRFGILAVLGTAALLAGCIESTTVINVKPDGSGTIEQTTTMNAQALAQMKQMAGAFGQAGGQSKGSLGLPGEQELRDAATKMGEGVTFVSATPIKTTAAEGTRAVYAFTDITKIRIDQKPKAPAGGGMGSMPAPGGSAPEDVMFRFARTPAGTSRVTVVFPEPKAGQKPKTAPAALAKDDPMAGAALAMMKTMLNGLKISIVLQPVGRLIKTNSPYVQGQQVTLLEVDMGQLASDEKGLQRLQDVQGAGSFEEMKAALKDVKGVKLNPQREVTVEFAGK